MALKRFSGGGTGGTTEAEDEDLTNEEVVRQAKRRQRETDAEADRATRDAQQDTGDMVDASGLTLDDLGLPGGSSGPRPTGSGGGGGGSSGGSGGGSSSSGGGTSTGDLNPDDFGADPNRTTEPTRTGGAGNELSDAEQQNVDAAVAEVNPRTRRQQQGVEGRRDAVGQQARELEQTVLERNPELSQEDVRVVRDGRQIRTELTPQGAEAVGANPTTSEVRQRVASQNENVDADDIVVTRTEDGEFDVGPARPRRDRQRSASQDVSRSVSDLDRATQQEVNQSFIQSRSRQLSGAQRRRRQLFGADLQFGEEDIQNLDRETQQGVNSVLVGSFAARTTTRTQEVQTQEEKFLNDILGGAPEEAQAAEESALGGLREDFSEGVAGAERGLSSGVDTVTSFGAAASERVTRRLNEDPTIQAAADSDLAQEIGRQADIAGQQLNTPLTPRGQRLVGGVQREIDAGIGETQRQVDIAGQQLLNPLTPRGRRAVETVRSPVDAGIEETQRQADIAGQQLSTPLTPRGERLVGRVTAPIERNADLAGRQLRTPLTPRGERVVDDTTDLVDENLVRPTQRNVEVAEEQLRSPLSEQGERVADDIGSGIDDGVAETQRQVDIAGEELSEPLTPRGERALDAAGEFTGDSDSRTLGGGLAGAAAAGVVAPEPVSTVGGGAVLGGIALAGIAGAAATGAANDALDDDGDGRATRIGTGEGVAQSELEVPEEGTTVVQSELDVSDDALFGSELGVRTGNFQRNEISVPDRGFSGTSGEISVPALGASQLSQQIRRGRQRERQREREENPFRRDPGGADEKELEEILRGPGDVTIEEEERLEDSREQTVRRDRERFTERRLNELRAGEEETNQSPEERFREAERSSVVGRVGPQAGNQPVAGVGADQQAGVQSDVDTDVLGRADVTQVQRQLQLQDQTQLQRQQQALRLAQPQAFAEPSLTTTVNSGEFLNPNEFVEVTENGTGRPGGDGRPRARRARLDFDPDQDFDDDGFSADVDNSLQINPVTAPDELDDALRLDGGD